MDELLEKDFWDTVKTKAKSALNKAAYNAVTKMGGSNQKLSNSVIATDLTKRWNKYLAQRRAGHKKIEGNADDLAFFIKRYFGDDAYSDVESLVDELRVEDNNTTTTTQNTAPVQPVVQPQPANPGRKIDWTNPNAIQSAMSRANPEQKEKMIATIKNAVQRNPKLVDEFPALKAYESQKSNSLNMLTEDELKTSQVYKVMQGLASYQLTNIKNKNDYDYDYRDNGDNRRRNPLTKIVTINGWNLIMHPENVNNIPNKTSVKYKRESEKYRKMISDRTIREIENQLKRHGGQDTVGELYQIATDREHLMDILLHVAAHSSR